MNTKKCKYCGKENFSDMKFCSECFNDTEIKGIIDKIDNEDICEVTNKQSKHIAFCLIASIYRKVVQFFKRS